MNNFNFLFSILFFKKDNISNAKVFNLANLDYIDKVKNGDVFHETNECINITEETDR